MRLDCPRVQDDVVTSQMAFVPHVGVSVFVIRCRVKGGVGCRR